MEGNGQTEPTPQNGDASHGGSGTGKVPAHLDGKGIFQNSHQMYEDKNLLKQALSKGWPISRRKRRRIVARLYEMVDNAAIEDDTAIAAANSLKGLDAINARREAAIAGGQAATAGVNIAVGVQIVQRDDFYGNDAHDRIAQADASSGNGHAVPSEVQDAGVWPQVGQNGNGTHVGRNGTRPEAGDAEGGD